MNSYNLLKANVSKYMHFTDEEFALFSSFFQVKSFKKKTNVLKEGSICNFEAFVIEGLLKTYITDVNGKEHILYFATTDWWITDMDSFINRRPAYLNIETIQDSQVLLLNHNQKELLYDKLPKVQELFRKMAQQTHAALQRRMIDHLSKTADIRYTEFLTKYPQLTNQLTNLNIAAYLGISHEFLSKIRRKIVSKK